MKHLLVPAITLIAILSGCSQPSDERLLALSEHTRAQQQSQNEAIAQQASKTVELSNDYIKAEASSRQELLELQQQLVEADALARADLQAIHQQVVERDTIGRQELDALHRQSQSAFSERTRALDQQRDLLEQERQQIAKERQRAPVISEAIKFAGGLIVCVLPLGVVVYLLRTLASTQGDVDAEMLDLLVRELTSEQPRLLPLRPRPALNRQTLVGPGEPGS